MKYTLTRRYSDRVILWKGYKDWRANEESGSQFLGKNVKHVLHIYHCSYVAQIHTSGCHKTTTYIPIYRENRPDTFLGTTGPRNSAGVCLLV